LKPEFVPESPELSEAVERVVDRAFGPGRFAKVSERVREFAPLDRTLSRVALDVNGDALGCCRLYRVAIGGRPALFLGPLAVEPTLQGVGVGARLVKAAVEASTGKADAVVLMGRPHFFQRLGFALIPPDRVQLPGPAEPRRLHWKALREGGLDGLEGALSAPRDAN
jgi:predicted N-acetyltransferase YhbS